MDRFKQVASLSPTQQAFSLAGEFKDFALRGNVIDLAVAVPLHRQVPGLDKEGQGGGGRRPRRRPRSRSC